MPTGVCCKNSVKHSPMPMGDAFRRFSSPCNDPADHHGLRRRRLLRRSGNLLLARWRGGQVTRAEERALGFPWTPAVVERGLGSSGATLAATRDALTRGLGVNLGGGTHHAYADHAEGFSFLNDVAISARWLLDTGQARRILILDLDVHQGNGTAAIFADEPRVLTVSLHAERNYPFRKETSDLDVPLPDGTDDAAYLHALDAQVTPLFGAFPFPASPTGCSTTAEATAR